MTTKSWRFYATIWTVFHIVSCSIDYATTRGKKPWGWDFFTNLVNISALLFLFQAMAICFFIIWSSKKFFPSKPVLYFAVMSVPLLFMAMSLDYATSCMIQDCISQYSLVQLLNDRGTFNGIIIIFGFMVKIFIDYLETDESKKQIMTEKNTIELAFLKSQINPHFLFNTLNNIYTLSTMNHANTAPSIMKLSHIMRYVTDEITEDLVPLASEIECISNYIDLQKLRLTAKTKVHFEVLGNVDYKEISPLILMAFVENAFKHAVSNREESEISVRIVEENNTIKFSCQNTLFTQARKVERTGIGIQNTKKRLEYSYPDKHILTISEQNGIYDVQLILL
jgi:Histidine kinase